MFESTTVRSPAPGFTAPYGLGYVELPERVRLLAQLDASGGRAPERGDRVRVVFRPFREEAGVPVIGFAFVRAEP